MIVKESFHYIKKRKFQEALVDAVDVINELQVWEWMRANEIRNSSEVYDAIKDRMRVPHNMASFWCIINLMHCLAQDDPDNFRTWLEENQRIFDVDY
jgi:hypothetical protein